MRDAYSHEVISHGFWPGSDPVFEPAFYAYAVPAPAGLETARVLPEAAFYHQQLGEFLLPHEAVRTAVSRRRDCRVRREHLRRGGVPRELGSRRSRKAPVIPELRRATVDSMRALPPPHP
jgi:hypothetical protein